MKFLSIKYLLNNIKDSFIKYPLVILSALIGVSLSVILVEYDDEITNKLPYINTLLTFYLGVPLFFCISVFNSKNVLTSKYLYVLYFLCLLFLGGIYLSLPSIDNTHNVSIPYIRYGVFNVIIHLLVSFTPYLKTKELNGFWNYNKALFLRLCTSVLYSTFIYVGLMIALFTVKTLFNISIHDELYFDIYIIIFGLFNTWFFVSGVPNNLNELENITQYPKGLKIFAQYILLPLLALYLIILYTYTGKIIINWDWPKGVVSYLISIVSILGFFNILLIHPYGKTAGNEWIKKFSKAFYFLLIPLIIVLFIALSMRVLDYGITIKRYAAITLGVWIGIVCIFFIFKKDNIKFIPISLSFLLLISSFGPWGMFSVSEKSQVHRLEKILSEHKILLDGKILNEVIWELDSLPEFEANKKLTNNHILNDSLHNEVKSILDYLDDHHGFKKIRPWFQQNINTMISDTVTHKRHSYNNEAKRYMETLGLEYQRKYTGNKNSKWFSFNQKDKTILNVISYDYVVPFNFYNNSSKTIVFTIDKIQYKLKRENDFLILLTDNSSEKFSLKELTNKLVKEYGENRTNDVPKDKMIILKTSKEKVLKTEFLNIDLRKNDSIKIKTIKGNLYIK